MPRPLQGAVAVMAVQQVPLPSAPRDEVAAGPDGRTGPNPVMPG